MADGFDPYDNLTKKQLREERAFFSRMCYIMRLVLHIFMIIATVYFIFMISLFWLIRARTTYAGEHVWIAKKISKMPYGAIFF